MNKEKYNSSVDAFVDILRRIAVENDCENAIPISISHGIEIVCILEKNNKIATIDSILIQEQFKQILIDLLMNSSKKELFSKIIDVR